MLKTEKDEQFCQIVEDQIERAVQQLHSFTKNISLDDIPDSLDDNKLINCGLVSPITIFQTLQEVRICYEIYLHIQAQELHRQIIIFPQLCSNINSGKLFQPRLSYPILNTFLTENPTCVSCYENRLFLTPQQSSLLSFVTLNNDLINPKSLKNTPSSSLSLEILAHNYFDCKRAMNIVKNFHPMQYLATLFVQNPEIFILLGQKVPSQTQRIGFFFGYIQYVQSLFAENSKISDENSDIRLNVSQLLPPSSLILTSFSRAVSCLIFKSLFEHNQTFENWPESYAYLPIHNANCYLQDFLMSIAGCIDVKVWVQNTFYKQIQNLYNEKATNYFENSVRDNSKIQNKLCVLIENYVKDLVINLKFLPDICKTVLSVAKVCLNNFVYNAIRSMFSQDEENQELKKRIVLQYPEIIDIIEESDLILSQHRADLFVHKLYSQFFNLFVGQCILQTAFGNPVSYGLIQPQQAYLEENQNFYSNLSFMADLICVAMNPKRNPIVFQLSDEVLSSERFVNLMNRNVKQFLFKKGLESAIYFREQIVEKLFSQIQLLVTPFLYAINDEDYIYPLDTVGVSRIFSASECQISETSVTHGYWVTISSYMLFCYNMFQQHVSYLKETIAQANIFYPQFLVTFYDTTSLQAQNQQEGLTTQPEYQFSCYSQLENLISFVQEQYRNEKLIEMFISELRIGNQQYQKVSIIPINSSSNICSNYSEADKQSATYVLNTISDILQSYYSQINGIVEQNEQSNIVDVTQSLDLFKEYITLLNNSKDSLSNAAQLRLELQQQAYDSEKGMHQFYEQIQLKVDKLVDDIKQEIQEFIHLQDIQQLQQIYQFLQQVSKDIMLFCQQLLNNNIPQPDFDILIDSNHLNQVYQRFDQIKQQYKQNKRQTSFDDMILNYRIMVDNMNSSVGGKTIFRAHRTLDKLYGYLSQKKHSIKSKVYLQLFEQKHEANDISQQTLQLSPNIQSICQRIQVPSQKQIIEQKQNDLVDVGQLYDQLLITKEFCRKDQGSDSIQIPFEVISVINNPNNDKDTQEKLVQQTINIDHSNNYSDDFMQQRLVPVEKQDSLRTIEEQKALSKAIDQDLTDSQNNTPVHEDVQQIDRQQNKLSVIECEAKQSFGSDQLGVNVDYEQHQDIIHQQEETTDVFNRSSQFENQDI